MAPRRQQWWILPREAKGENHPDKRADDRNDRHARRPDEEQLPPDPFAPRPLTHVTNTRHRLPRETRKLTKVRHTLQYAAAKPRDGRSKR